VRRSGVAETAREVDRGAQILQHVNDELSVMRSEMLKWERRFVANLDELPDGRRASARNLVHYLALRRHDPRPLQNGPFILNAVRALDNILTRMQAHQRKKSAMLRHVHIADLFFDAA
jgi:hypothetical protein